MNYIEIEKKLDDILYQLEGILKFTQKDLENIADLDVQYQKDRSELDKVEQTVNNLRGFDLDVSPELMHIRAELKTNIERIEIIRRVKEKISIIASYFGKDSSQKRTKKSKRQQSNLPESEYTGKKPLSFSFLSTNHKISNWKQILVEITKLMYELHPDDFQKIYNIKGRDTIYFSTTPDILRRPVFIDSAGIFCETNFSARDCVGISRRIIKLFGYNTEDLDIFYELD